SGAVGVLPAVDRGPEGREAAGPVPRLWLAQVAQHSAPEGRMSLVLEAHGQRIRLQDRPGVISRAWKRGEPYESPLLEHIYLQGFRGLALDVGANVGNHALWLSVVCGLKTVAFEPIHHDALRQNVRLNQAEVR